jgi:hypothetical protein
VGAVDLRQHGDIGCMVKPGLGCFMGVGQESGLGWLLSESAACACAACRSAGGRSAGTPAVAVVSRECVERRQRGARAEERDARRLVGVLLEVAGAVLVVHVADVI